VILTILVLVVAVGFAGLSLASARPGAARTLSVVGTGTAKGTPDTVSFGVGVTTTANSATRALALNSAHLRRLERALRRHGVTAAGMQTSGLNIWQHYNNRGQVDGFTVDDELTVTMHRLADAGGAIDAAARAVGNGVQFDGVSFSLSNDSKLLARARAAAVAQAGVAARELARGAHTALGAPLRIREHETSSSSGTYYPLAGYAAANEIRSVPISAGTESVTVTATVVYQLGG
jgi:uncharacterized protein YggE